MKIGVLTSSRADYSIYFPLLKVLNTDPFFELHIIAFGTHLSEAHGMTVSQIIADGFSVPYQLDTMPEGDTAKDITQSMARTMTAFSTIWEKEKFNLVFSLGDRYEMFAACAASVPFNVQLAHIHGGEQTTGAIDDVFRHSITHMAAVHFTTTEKYRERVVQLKAGSNGVYNTGALSIDNLKSLQLLSAEAFKEKFGIDISVPSVLVTLHPETVDFEKNIQYADELIAALKEIKEYQFIITMPNADVMGTMIREKLTDFVSSCSNAVAVNSFGTMGYLSCMKHCSFMLGNTSSGFVEASYFPRYVINLGKRQTGRIMTENIVNCEINKDAILAAVSNFSKIKLPTKIDVYGEGNAAEKIVSIIKEKYA